MGGKILNLKNQMLSGSMLRWGVVGISTTLIDYSIFILIYGLVKSVVIANFISGIFATLINYYSHHKWTFKSKRQHSRSGANYLINLIFWWLIATLIIKSLIILNIDPRIAKLVPLIFIVPINYFVLNNLVFKKTKHLLFEKMQ